MHRNGPRDIRGRSGHEDRFQRDQDRNWFDRARDNVRGWFRSDDGPSPDRDEEHDRYASEEERAGRADHQVFGGRGLQAYDNPREVERDEQRRFGGREPSYSQRDRDWFHHPNDDRNDRSWVGGDEPPRRMRDRDDHDERRYAQSNRYPQQDTRYPQRDTRYPQRDTRYPQQDTRYPQQDPRYAQPRNRDMPRGSRDLQPDNRYIRHDEPRFRSYDRDDDRSRSGDAFGRLRDDHGRYAGGPVPRDDRHRYADTDDDARNNWRAWSGRASEHDRDRPYAHERLARDDRSRLAPTRDDERYGHPSTRGNRLDYDQQFVSNTERGDEDRASRTYGRDEDQDRGFVPRDEYGRRRR